MATVVSDIANASMEQSTGIDQINKALTQMDEATQQNSALVEENAATAKTLENQAKSMGEQIEFFKVDPGASDREFGRRALRPCARSRAINPAPRQRYRRLSRFSG